MARVGWFGSCSVVVVGLGFVVVGIVVVVGVGGRSWSLFVVRFFYFFDLVECIGGILIFLFGVWDFCIFCYGVCYSDFWDGFVIFEKKKIIF